MKSLVYLLLGLTLAQAANAADYSVGLLMPTFSYLQDSDLNYSLKQGQSFFFQKKWNESSLELEYSKLSETSGNATLAVSNTDHLALIIFRRSLFLHQINQDVHLNFGYLLGFGLAQTEVDSRLSGQTTKSTGSMRIVSSLGLGAESQFLPQSAWSPFVGTDLRVLQDKEKRPSLYWALNFRFGIYF